MSATIQWNGEEVKRLARARLTSGLQRFNEELAGAARANLFPGHGLQTGTLQDATQAQQMRDRGPRRIESSVGAPGVAYGLFIHEKYRFILNALDQLTAAAAATISRG